MPAEELVERSTTIVLARVVKAELSDETGEVIYTFSTMRALKGKPAASFTLTGDAMMWEGELQDFDFHQDAKFWEDNSGRMHHDTDCLIHPTFTVGTSYLIFPDAPYHRKSFELIIRTHGEKDVRDKWLSWVEETIKKQNKAEMATPRKPSD
ncbi:hypothetical protein [Luteolibacter sp. AS25]|uniref:hypothetical protein n=1 Tax=Luteolibacter sp. AS25 TaxID=3135776 RepID=UPI00398A56BF